MKLDFFTQIKALFNSQEEVEKTQEIIKEETNFADAKTKDGIILKITPALEEGALVEIISEDGTTSSPMPGEIYLEDGTTIVVDESGKIVSIENASVESIEDSEEEMKKNEVKKEVLETPDIESRIMACEQAIQMLIDGLSANGVLDMASKTKKMESEVKKLSSEKEQVIVEKNEVVVELEKVKTELAKFKAAPSLSFKVAALKTETPREPELTEMQKKIRELANKNK